MRLYINFILTVFVCFVTFAALAANYQVNDIKVDVEAESAIDARDKAYAQARRNAFNVLMGRVGVAGPKADDRTIAMMVDSFEINREKLSKNRYLASVNVKFNENAVQTYLGMNTTMAMPDQQPLYANQPQAQDSLRFGTQGQAVAPYGQSTLYEQYQQQRQSTAESRYKIQVALANVRQWVDIQRQLNAIGSVAILSLKSNQAIIDFGFSGDATLLQTSLQQRGMTLYANDNMMFDGGAPYILMTRG